MTMMATQEPIDPSVLLSHNNNNSTNTNDTTTSLKETTDNDNDDDDPSSELCTSLSAPSSSGDNGEIGNTTNNKTTIPITTSVTTKLSNSSSNGYNNNNINAMSRTPPRSSLATDPSLTPIASIKRPRANLNKSNSDLTGSCNSANRSNHNTTTAMLMSPKTPTPHSSNSTMTPTTTTRRSSSAIESSTPLSPMHKIKPVLHRETVHHNNNNVSTSTTSLNTNTQSSSSPSEYQQNSSKEIIKDKVEELFSPVVQFLHEHEEHGISNIQQQQPPHSTTSISEDQSFNEFDHHNHYNTNTEDDDDDAVLQEEDNVNVDIDVDDDDESMSRPEQHDDITNEGEFNPWQFIASLPPYDTVACHRPPITLPPLTMTTSSSSLFNGINNNNNQQLRKTLVLDLDETLVHCSVTEPMDHIVDFTFPVQFHGETYSVHVKCRPYLYEFLNEMSQHFEIIVFTASQKVYADALLNIIDPDGRCIHHRLFRESCLAVEGNYLKDLNVLGRDLRHTVLVDNSPHAFGYQVSNGIPIESWFDCPNDRELIKLQRFLLSHVLPADDVRIPVRNKFQSHVLIESAPPFQH